MNRPLVKYVLTACARDRLIISVIVAAAIAVALSLFVGSSAVIEKPEFILVFAASSLRFLSVAGLILFVVFYTNRTIDTKELDFLLTRPITRPQFILSHLIAFIALCLFFTILATLVLTAVAYQFFTPVFLLWSFSFFVELLITTMAAFFFAMVLSSVVSASLSTLAFYAFARLIGQILGIALDPGTGGDNPLLATIVKLVSLFIPRLDLLTQTTWLLYGVDEAWHLAGLVAIQGLIFTAVLAMAAMIDLLRREF